MVKVDQPTDGPTNRPTTILLELLKAAKTQPVGRYTKLFTVNGTFSLTHMTYGI